LPNDDREQDRMDMLHHVFLMCVGGALWRAPIVNDTGSSPKRILDLGCGTGLWCLEAADILTDALVEGVDLSPIQPTWVPPNCSFYVDDFEEPWTYDSGKKFDYIHGRAMAACIADWPKLFTRIYENLEDGGYVEFQEFRTW
jgi:cyclopropane fatty-acyl-phospholipid synthase-like methyltransferase